MANTVSKESAITIGMYPDMDRDHIINAGNSSLEGAQKLLLNREVSSPTGIWPDPGRNGSTFSSLR
ncbi:MAG: ASKHA domain-containing protein [Ruminococcus sp.]